MEQLKLCFTRISEHAFTPSRATPEAAGLDLRSAYHIVIPKHERMLILTDLAIQIPQNCYGRIAPRSGLSLHKSIDVGAGVIDRDFTGNVGVLLINHSDEDFIVHRGDRIAQLICEVILYPEPMEVKSLNSTERGTRGFGSTGLQ